MSIKVLRKSAVLMLALAMLLMLFIPTAKAAPAFSYPYRIFTNTPTHGSVNELLPDWSGIGRSTRQVHYKGSYAEITVRDVNGMSGVTATYNGVVVNVAYTTTINETDSNGFRIRGTGYVYVIPNLGNEASNTFILRRGSTMVDNLSIYLS